MITRTPMLPHVSTVLPLFVFRSALLFPLLRYLPAFFYLFDASNLITYPVLIISDAFKDMLRSVTVCPHCITEPSFPSSFLPSPSFPGCIAEPFLVFSSPGLAPFLLLGWAHLLSGVTSKADRHAWPASIEFTTLQRCLRAMFGVFPRSRMITRTPMLPHISTVLPLFVFRSALLFPLMCYLPAVFSLCDASNLIIYPVLIISDVFKDTLGSVISWALF